MYNNGQLRYVRVLPGIKSVVNKDGGIWTEEMRGRPDMHVLGLITIQLIYQLSYSRGCIVLSSCTVRTWSMFSAWLAYPRMRGSRWSQPRHDQGRWAGAGQSWLDIIFRDDAPLWLALSMASRAVEFVKF